MAKRAAAVKQELPPWPGDYDAAADMRASVEFAYEAIRARVAAGGPGWTPPFGNEQAKLIMFAGKIMAEKAGKCPKTG